MAVRIRRAFAVLLLALLLAPLVGVTASAGPDEVPVVPCQDPRGCPDLVADGRRMSPFLQVRTFQEDDCNVVEGSTEAGTRRLLRFTFTTLNRGPGDLIVGVPEAHPEWFEYAPCHGHHHFKLYAEYRLWAPAAHARWEALRNATPEKTAEEVLAENPDLRYVRGHKGGFCVIDVVRYQLTPPKYLACKLQGISVGWADEYAASLDGQYVDVTDVPHGAYVLEEEVNPHRLFVETDYANNRAWSFVVL